MKSTELDKVFVNTLNTQQQTEEEEEGGILGGIDGVRILATLNKSIGWILLFILITVGGAYFYLKYTKPLYESSSIIKLDFKSENVGIKMNNSGQLDENNIAGELEIIRSGIVYDRVIDALPLDINYYIRGNILEAELYKNSPFKVTYQIKDNSFYDVPFYLDIINEKDYNLRYFVDGEEVTTILKFDKEYENDYLKFSISLTDFFNPSLVGKSFSFIFNSKAAQRGYIARNMSAKVLNASAKTILIAFTDHNPSKAQEIVKTIDEAYLEATLDKKRLASEQTLKFLEWQLDSTEKILTNSEMQVENFIRATQTLSATKEIQDVLDKIKKINEAKNDIRKQVDYLVKIKQLAIIDTGDIAKSVPMDLVKSPQIVKLVEEIDGIKTEKRKLDLTYKKSSLLYEIKGKRSTEIKQELLDMIELNKRVLQEEIKDMEDSIKSYQKQFYKLPSFDTEFARINRFLSLNEKFYLMLLERRAEYGIQQASIVPDFQILAPANYPNIPISPKKGQVYMIGILLGLGFGIALVAARYLLDDTVINQRDIERAAYAPVLGVIPTYYRERMEISQLVVDKYPKSSVSETMRNIRTNLEFINNKKKKSISVTSTIGGEGKTFVAINFAGILALSNQKVVIVDLDMRKPKIHLAFDVEGNKGMSTLLIGKHKLDECIYKTSIDTLDFIPAGPIPPNPSELIMRQDFDETIEELKKRYDIILFDSPPVGLVTDGIIIMQKVDTPIYVMRSAYSKRNYIKNINKLVRANGFTNLSVVLNAVDNFKTYGYGYGYGYEYYTDDERPTGLDTTWIRNLFGRR